MPGADEAMAVEFSVAQRAAIVRANIVDAVVITIDERDDDKSLVDFDTQLAVSGDVSGFCKRR